MFPSRISIYSTSFMVTTMSDCLCIFFLVKLKGWGTCKWLFWKIIFKTGEAETKTFSLLYLSMRQAPKMLDPTIPNSDCLDPIAWRMSIHFKIHTFSLFGVYTILKKKNLKCTIHFDVSVLLLIKLHIAYEQVVI